MLSYFEAIVIGLIQGATELFPISSLGHSILIPSWMGWDSVVGEKAVNEAFYLAFLVGLHVATSFVLLIYFRKDWLRVFEGVIGLAKRRKVETPNERLAWLLLVATIPTGIIGLTFESPLGELFNKPLSAAIFLSINGVILLAGERLRRRSERTGGTKLLATLKTKEGAFIGIAQIGALFAGISRSGITMVAGLFRGLSHEDAAHFSFLLATPIIFGAGIYKAPDLFKPEVSDVRGQVLVGTLCAAFASYFAVRFLMRFFRSNNLNIFGIYCLLFGLASVFRFA